MNGNSTDPIDELFVGIGNPVSADDRAFTKTEVSAILCRAAALIDVFPVPEFPTAPTNSLKGEYALDVVWAVRAKTMEAEEHGFWIPVAAFEIDNEAIDVPGKKVPVFERIRPMVDVVRAHVLFRLNENGTWRSVRPPPPEPPRNHAARTRNYVRRVKTAIDASAPPWLQANLRVLVDSEVRALLPEWLDSARDEAKRLRADGRAAE